MSHSSALEDAGNLRVVLPDPTIPPPGPSCFFNLPREIRDVIYEYALTEDGGLILIDNEAGWPRFRGAENDEISESNQLRYVCRQPHSETSGLGLRYNSLTFATFTQLKCKNITDFPWGPNETVYDVFQWFMDHCSETNLRRIQRVVLLDGETGVEDDPEEALIWSGDLEPRALRSPGLAYFCEKYSDALIIIRFNWDWLAHEEGELIDLMYDMYEALNRPCPFPNAAGYITHGFNGRGTPTFTNCPRNLRFSATFTFPEDAALDNLDRIFDQNDPDDLYELGLKPLNEDDKVVWLEIARDVHENGI